MLTSIYAYVTTVAKEEDYGRKEVRPGGVGGEGRNYTNVF